MATNNRFPLWPGVVAAIGMALALSAPSGFAQSDPDDPVLMAPDVGPATSPGQLPFLRSNRGHRRIVAFASPVAPPRIATRPLVEVKKGPAKKEKKAPKVK